MKVIAMLLADFANYTNDGKINLLGAGFDMWPRPQFPALAHVVVYIRIEILASEGGDHTISLDLITSDGRSVIPRQGGQFKVPAGPPMYRYLNLTYELAFQIPAPDDYSFRVVIDGQEMGSCPVKAQLLPPTTLGQAPAG